MVVGLDIFTEHFKAHAEQCIAEIGNKKQFYRFVKPQAQGYPKMIELFSRKPDSIAVPEGFHLTDIPTDEEASSLSAIFKKMILTNTERM